MPISFRSSSVLRRGGVLLLATVATLTVAACNGGQNRPRLAYEERPVELLYNTGYQRLENRRWADAIDYFQEVERQHPYSEWSRRAILMQIYAYYQNGNYEESIAASDRFIQLFPGSPSAAYAYYMRATCNFEQIVDVGRDQASAATTSAPTSRWQPSAATRPSSTTRLSSAPRIPRKPCIVWSRSI